MNFSSGTPGSRTPFLYQSKLQNNNYLNIIGFCSVCLVYLFATDDTNVSLHAGLSSRTDRTKIYSTKHFLLIKHKIYKLI